MEPPILESTLIREETCRLCDFAKVYLLVFQPLSQVPVTNFSDTGAEYGAEASRAAPGRKLRKLLPFWEMTSDIGR